ncbi:hypothetical protein AOLI_G00097610 [Acnodon oligacanthus]
MATRRINRGSLRAGFPYIHAASSIHSALHHDKKKEKKREHAEEGKGKKRRNQARWRRRILMRLELKPSRRAASIKACHSPQQLPIRQLRLGFRALAYRHLHTRLAPAQDHATKSRMIGKQIKMH